MRPIRVAQDILPVSVVAADAERYLDEVRESGRPLVLTQRGRVAGVLVPAEEFARLNGVSLKELMTRGED